MRIDVFIHIIFSQFVSKSSIFCVHTPSSYISRCARGAPQKWKFQTNCSVGAARSGIIAAQKDSLEFSLSVFAAARGFLFAASIGGAVSPQS